MSIALNSVSCRLSNTWSVRGVTVGISPGEVVGLIGPNGAGKTTLLRIIATLQVPSEGTVSVLGHDACRSAFQIRRRIGFVPEFPPDLGGDARVEEWLTLRAALKDIPRRARRSEVDRCLQACDLVPVRQRVIGRLSHGFRRRVSLADALLGDPPVLLLDEPTVGLDPAHVSQVRSLLMSLARERTVIVSTHVLGEAETMCGRILIMLRGRLLDDLRVSDLNLAGFEAEIQASADVLRAWVVSTGMPNVEVSPREAGWCRLVAPSGDSPQRESLVRACQQSGWMLRELRSRARSLEDHFVRLMLQPRAA